MVNRQVYHGFSNSACEVGYMKFENEEFQNLGSSKTLVRKIEGKLKRKKNWNLEV